MYRIRRIGVDSKHDRDFSINRPTGYDCYLLLFVKTNSAQKPLRLDKNGCPTSISLSGFVRKMFVLFICLNSSRVNEGSGHVRVQ